MLNNSLRLFTIRGIEVGVHYSWIFIFGLVTYTLAVAVFPDALRTQRIPAVEYWILGAITSLLLFVSVLVHELAHSFVAQARGINARSITLFIFGGVSNLAGDAKDSSTEFLVAIVGPLMSFVLAAITFAAAELVSEPRAEIVLSYLFFINLMLGIFNLVPGFPLDGGRVLRAVLWRVTGNVKRATVWAANVGKLVAFLMFGYAVYSVVVMENVIGGLWTAAIAWFLYSAASGSVQQLVFDQRLRRVRVGEAIRRDDTTVTPYVTVGDLIDRYFLPAARSAVPVAEDGRLIGLVAIRDIASVPVEQRPYVTVGQVMGGQARLHTVAADATLFDAFELLGEDDLEQLLVMEGDRYVGLLTRADVARQLQLRDDLDI